MYIICTQYAFIFSDTIVEVLKITYILTIWFIKNPTQDMSKRFKLVEDTLYIDGQLQDQRRKTSADNRQSSKQARNGVSRVRKYSSLNVKSQERTQYIVLIKLLRMNFK